MPLGGLGIAPLGDSDPGQVGPYRLLGRLGSGAMGRVYLGVDRDGRRAAVKVVRDDLAGVAVFRRRFTRELDVVRRVGGPGVARVVAADPDAPCPWLATEYVAGPTLQAAVDDDGPLATPAARALAHDIARALTAIHAAGVVHRDLKPSNVLLAADGPVVIDFGVAHAVDATRLTSLDQNPGTPAYMAPEQIESRAVGPASDVFALGALLAFATTGRSVFGAGPVAAVLHRVLNSPPDLDGAAADDARFRALIEACLAKDPGERPGLAEIVEACRPRGTAPAPPTVVRTAPAAQTVLAVEPGLATVVTGPRPAAGPAEPPGPPEPPALGRKRRARVLALAVGTAAVALALIAATFADGGSGSSNADPGSNGAAPKPGEEAAAGASGPGSDAQNTSALTAAPPGTGPKPPPTGRPTTPAGSHTGTAPGGPTGPTESQNSASNLSPAGSTPPPSSLPGTSSVPSSPPSPTKSPTTAPVTPSNPTLAIVGGQPAAMQAAWTSPGDADAFDLEINGVIYNMPGAARSYTFATQAGVNYCVRVKASNPVGYSGWTALVCKTA